MTDDFVPVPLGKIIELRSGNLRIAAHRQHDRDVLNRIGSLLRRRTMTPLQGKMVIVEFETETEAWAFHKLVGEFSRRKRPRKARK